MKLLDLFSGIGGFSLAAEWAGIETVAFCERDPFCQKVLKKHWPHIPIHDDIKTLKGFPVDMITAGFPCQPFSVAGKKKGISDDRYLWPDTIRLIRECKPSWVILENVPGIIPHLDPILEDLESENYDWQAFLIAASEVHAPHKRERLWIIAFSNSQHCNIRKRDWEGRYIQDDFKRHVEEIQSEWDQWQPRSWTTFSAQEWLTPSDPNSAKCDKRTTNNDAVSERSEWQKFTAKIGNANGHTNIEPDAQTNQAYDTIGSSRQTWDEHRSEHWRDASYFGWEEDQPPIPGVDDGVPFGLHRNTALGNSIVPQIPYLFMRIILEIEKCYTEA